MSSPARSAWPVDDQGSLCPTGWTITTVQNVSHSIEYGYTASASNQPIGPKLLRITDIQNGSVDWNEVPYCKLDGKPSSRFRLNIGDIVFARTGATTGKSYLIREETPDAVFASYLIRVRPNHLVDPAFLYLFFQTSAYWQLISENVAGNAQPNCNASKLAALPLLLPPVAEQRRIVSAAERLQSLVNNARQRLVTARKILNRFCQSALAAACTGRLTADWRSAMGYIPDPSNELPNSWKATTVGEVIESLKYGSSRKCDYGMKGVPVLRIPNIGDGVTDRRDLKYAELEPREFDQLRLRAGDVLMIRSNGSVSLLGKSALIGEADANSAYAGYLIRLRPNQTKIIPEYLNAVLGSFPVRLQIELPARLTSGVNNINSDEVRALPINLPPLDEQAEIMKRLSNMSAVATKIESKVLVGTQRSNMLVQATLAKAFRGELVATEAELADQEGQTYQTAEELLKTTTSTSAPQRRRRG